jgi:hypothetical protein
MAGLERSPKLRWVTDWSTTASFLTAGGTLVLAVAGAISAGELAINLLYGDFEGGQRVISQFSLRQADERWLTQAARHYNVDRPDPR